MALGIACAGTGSREAIALLEPMVKFDPVNFVRQGALVSAFIHQLVFAAETCIIWQRQLCAFAARKLRILTATSSFS